MAQKLISVSNVLRRSGQFSRNSQRTLSGNWTRLYYARAAIQLSRKIEAYDI